MSLLPNIKLFKGQTLIGLLLSITLFAILGHALFSLVSASYVIVSYLRANVTAKNLAIEKMESIRNLSYDDVGTQGGIPSGQLPQLENIQKNGINYLIKTSIVYIDDPFDENAPDDLLPTDYKRVRVGVSWEGIASSSKNLVTLISDIAPQGVESTLTGGTLSILVFDSQAQPVGQAVVTIVASSVTPAVNMTLETADNGRVILPGAPPCSDSCYQISVTKDGYSTERTYSSIEVANPDKPNSNVIQGQITEISFAIDKISTINVASLIENGNLYQPLGNVTFNIRGNKTIGIDTEDNPVYKYENAFTTTTNGNYTLSDIEWDNYQISIDSSETYDISGTNPIRPVNVLPDQEIDLSILLNPESANSALVAFTDQALNPIASVAAKLYDGAAYEATGSSGLEENPDFGQIYFADLNPSFYNLYASVSGYLDFNGVVDVNGSKYEIIILNPI